VLRIKNLIKRSTRKVSGNELVCGPFRFVKNELQFFLDGQQVDLTSTEFKLLLYLCERQNASQDRHALLMDVMGYSSEVHSRTLDTHMKRLRKKLGVHADIVETVRGVGYQVKLPL
jgi:two-component system phosphate regulon response regulator PhoB